MCKVHEKKIPTKFFDNEDTVLYCAQSLFRETREEISLTRRYRFDDNSSSFLETFWDVVNEFFDDQIENEVGYEQSVYRQLMELGFTEYENEDEEVEGSFLEIM